ncbi:MAG: M20/M25/M40 family metallo-hydrolase, partial [Chitinophagaceae bacterium]
ISVGSMHSGVRSNIIPETAEMNGTVRTLDAAMRLDVHNRMRRTVKMIAESAGATAEVDIVTQTLVNYNDPVLAKKLIPSLQKAAGIENVSESGLTTAAEDFSFYGQKAPSFFFSLGGMAKGKDPDNIGQHHTPDFFLDESGFIIGVKAFCNMVFDYAKTK